MKDPRLQLKNPLIAAVLALLMPGAGHWYQGRRFKATIYSVGILTLFFWGMILGNWQPVYSQLVSSAGSASSDLHDAEELGSDYNLHLGQTVDWPPRMNFSFGYAAQFMVGLPAMPALVQEMRFRSDRHDAKVLDAPVSGPFHGMLIENGLSSHVSGDISVEPIRPEGSRTVKGVLKVVGADGGSKEYPLSGTIRLGRAVFGSPDRLIECSIENSSSYSANGIKGFVSRPFINWYQAPRDGFELDRLHGNLSRKFDIATVFTWIAGLLNLLAIWDAAGGPAYGYGDEKPEDEEDDDKRSPDSKSPDTN